MRARGLTQMPDWGIDTVTMPGAVDAFCVLSQDWGRLGLAASLACKLFLTPESSVLSLLINLILKLLRNSYEFIVIPVHFY